VRGGASSPPRMAGPAEMAQKAGRGWFFLGGEFFREWGESVWGFARGGGRV
jgi:hypothetical protein